MRTHTDSSDLVVDSVHPLNYTALATQTEGYLANDLKDLVARAVHRAAIRVADHEEDAGFQVSHGYLHLFDIHAHRVEAKLVGRGFCCSTGGLRPAISPRC